MADLDGNEPKITVDGEAVVGYNAYVGPNIDYFDGSYSLYSIHREAGYSHGHTVGLLGITRETELRILSESTEDMKVLSAHIHVDGYTGYHQHTGFDGNSKIHNHQSIETENLPFQETFDNTELSDPMLMSSDRKQNKKLSWWNYQKSNGDKGGKAYATKQIEYFKAIGMI